MNAAAARPGAVVAGSWAVNQKTLPAPTSLVTPIVPDMASANGREMLVNATAFWLIVSVQIIVGAAFAFPPCAVGALSLGLVGRDALPKRQGTNQAPPACGFPATFLTLAAVAGCAFTVFIIRMPETCAAAGRATPASAAA